VVFQPNFRGSSGFGDAWEDAGHGEWGGLMQTDVEDGVRALIRAKIADPAKSASRARAMAGMQPWPGRC
jgi:dipeptidyl aminopeptidase/acylaminoacyl peptidase